MNMHSVEKKVLLGVLVCFFASVVGVSFAYFTASITSSGTGGSVSGTTSELIKVKYDAGSSALSLNDAYPGKSASKSFSVTVTPGDITSATYSISLNISSNTFVKCSSSNYNATTNACTTDAQELVYTLKDGSGTTLATGDLLGKTGSVVLIEQTKTVSSATVYNYTLEIAFKDTNADQNHNINKSFASSLKVAFS